MLISGFLPINEGMVELADTSGLSPDGLSVRVQVSLPSPICQRVGIGRRGGLKNRCFMRVSSSLTVDTTHTGRVKCDSPASFVGRNPV